MPTTVEIVTSRPQRRDTLATAFPIDTGERPEMIGFMLRDVTQERDLERRRDTFISIASHELRTPMTTIMGFSELLLLRDPPEATRHDWLKRINEDSRRLSGIVDDLLNVSRIQSGRLSLKLESLSLSEVVEAALADVKPGTVQHDFMVSIGSEIPHVVADRDKFAQVLVNLLTNAVKYSPNGGQVTVSAAPDSKRDRVVVEVADEGIGIAAEDREHLFSTFHRIQRPETESIRGTGLGLYIVRELVELMRGEVWVESELNVGSSFFFSLPTKIGRRKSLRVAKSHPG